MGRLYTRIRTHQKTQAIDRKLEFVTYKSLGPFLCPVGIYSFVQLWRTQIQNIISP